MKTHDNVNSIMSDFDADVIEILKRVIPVQLEPLTLKGYAETKKFDESMFAGRFQPGEPKGTLQVELDVLSAIVPEDNAYDMVTTLQAQLEPHGYQALITANRHKDFGYIFEIGLFEAAKKYAEQAMIVVFEAETPTSLLWVRETNGANYDVTTSDIVHTLSEWANRCSFRMLGAGFDWVELEFTTLPKDLLAFAEEIYEFCPDTLDQNVVKAMPEELSDDEFDDELDEQSTEALANSLKREKRLFLWWD